MLDSIVKRNKDEKAVRTIMPYVNIEEKVNEIILQAEMPGLAQEDITVEVQGEDLVIEARKENNIPKGYIVVYQERIPVQYKRVFTLGKEIDKSNIQARYENGILVVTLSKSESAKPRKITVS